MGRMPLTAKDREITPTNHLSEDGLTGVSGLGAGGLFHIAANYAACTRKGQPAMCFVEWYARGERVPDWRRMTVARARKEGRRIITCARSPGCKEPAVSVDHYWPYMRGANCCAAHRELLVRDE